MVPWFAKSLKDFGYNTINAKAETISTNRMWAGPLERRRCIIPADGFYEWKLLEPPEDVIVAQEQATASLFGEVPPAKPAKKLKKSAPEKQPYVFTLRSGQPFGFAGLWDRWRDPENAANILESYTVITTDPNELTAHVHTRMPVILAPADYGAWLAAEPGKRAPVELLRPFPAELMHAAKANREVGNVRNNDPGLMFEVPPANSL
jgi:putative SOS response-associated peptidase YedK